MGTFKFPSAFKKAQAYLYCDKLQVFRLVNALDENNILKGEQELKLVEGLEDIPCRLCYKNVTKYDGDGVAVGDVVVTAVHVDPSIPILSGDVLSVVQGDGGLMKGVARMPRVYQSHLEVELIATTLA